MFVTSLYIQPRVLIAHRHFQISPRSWLDGLAKNACYIHCTYTHLGHNTCIHTYTLRGWEVSGSMVGVSLKKMACVTVAMARTVKSRSADSSSLISRGSKVRASPWLQHGQNVVNVQICTEHAATRTNYVYMIYTCTCTCLSLHLLQQLFMYILSCHTHMYMYSCSPLTILKRCILISSSSQLWTS